MKTNVSSTRRDFLHKLGVSAAATAVAGTQPLTAHAAVRKRNIQYAMLIDTRRCTGCHACSVACKAEYDVPLGVNRSWVEYVEKGDYPNVTRNFLPRLCNHCDHPDCVSVCPTGATYKREEDGVVVIDEDVCIGCGYCIQACPYDMRFLNPVTGTAEKCDFCEHLVSKGIQPACVETCIGSARIFGDINDPTSEIAQMIATNPVSVLRPDKGTEPNVYYIAADHSGEHERQRNRYVRVTTHRKQKIRR
ncbi:MAG: 4Fe-4S dicluster domain-containing protein [Gammaproteobacteria bacterium]|nr:4Fe-4S dicluster domain-containing protein [Gammaproteobacteria bacterium]